MNPTIRSQCRRALSQYHTQLRTLSSTSTSLSTSPSSSSLTALLSKPSWSVRSLLPPSSPSSSSPQTPSITPQTLQHLLRLSALPPPRSAAEESTLLSTLQSQLHFVRAVREIDTTGVEPLRAIRDETARGLREQTIGVAELRDALANEDVVGHARRPRRRRRERERGEARVGVQAEAEAEAGVGQGGKEGRGDPSVEGWDVLAGASETAGRYFVVRTKSSGLAKIGTGTNQGESAKET